MNLSQTLTRKTLIDIAQRRQQAGSGSAPAFLAQRTTSMQWPDLSPVLAPLPWAVVGAAATRLYMPERFTQDLDIAILVKDGAAATQKLSAAGYTKLSDLSIGGATWRTTDGQLIDLIEGHDPWWPVALQEAQRNRDRQGLPILPLPYLVLMKFNAGRTRDLGDITQMLGQADESKLVQVRALFKLYTADGLDDLESLILLGKLEMGR